jgi:hypothetical protein
MCVFRARITFPFPPPLTHFSLLCLFLFLHFDRRLALCPPPAPRPVGRVWLVDTWTCARPSCPCCFMIMTSHWQPARASMYSFLCSHRRSTGRAQRAHPLSFIRYPLSFIGTRTGTTAVSVHVASAAGSVGRTQFELCPRSSEVSVDVDACA